jgi:hypothetical protein
MKGEGDMLKNSFEAKDFMLIHVTVISSLVHSGKGWQPSLMGARCRRKSFSSPLPCN